MTNVIDYAPAIPWYRRNRWWRWAVLLGLLAALVVSWWLAGPQVYHRMMFIYWQHRSLVREDPPGKVMMEAACNMQWDVTGSGAAFPPPEVEAAANHLPRMGKSFLTEFMVKGSSRYPIVFYLRDPATIFCHRRTSTLGERLVVVIGFPYVTDYGPRPPGKDAALYAAVVEPGGMNSAPKVVSLRHIENMSLSLGGTLKVLAGTCDPKDAAVFTIPIENSGRHYTLQCRLVGNTVEAVRVP